MPLRLVQYFISHTITQHSPFCFLTLSICFYNNYYYTSHYLFFIKRTTYLPFFTFNVLLSLFPISSKCSSTSTRLPSTFFKFKKKTDLNTHSSKLLVYSLILLPNPYASNSMSTSPKTTQTGTQQKSSLPMTCSR